MKKIIGLGICLNILFFVFLAKATWFNHMPIYLKSPTFKYVHPQENPIKKIRNKISQVNDSIDSKSENPKKLISKELSKLFDTKTNDSLPRVLLIGDSQLECLRSPVRKRLKDNGYNFVGSVIWYGSGTKHWASTDTLNYFLRNFKPDIVLIALGLNELFVNDLDQRALYAQQIKNKLDAAHVAYYYIGPAAWVKDKGITKVLAETFGDLFYPSHQLTLARAADGRHPSQTGGKVWFDAVASQITRQGILNLSMVKDTTYKGHDRTVILKVPQE